jgi:hypothetical protein
LLAPQRGRIANAKRKTIEALLMLAGPISLFPAKIIIPELSNFRSPPAKPGVYLRELLLLLVDTDKLVLC